MLPRPAYFILLTLCWMYALLRGGKAERVGATIMIVASVLSVVFVSEDASRFGSVETGILVVDFAAFVAFVSLALRADRFWPIWVSAFAGLGVIGHLGRWYAGDQVIPWAYWLVLVVWTYPILASLAIGTMNYQRRVAPFGRDKSWAS